jgi:hypothetical protein
MFLSCGFQHSTCQHAAGNHSGKRAATQAFLFHVPDYNSAMHFLDKLVEEKIRQAREDGAFDNLPGTGKPLELDDDSSVPEDLRLAWKVLKNSGCLPPEIELRKDIYNLRQLLDSVTDSETRRKVLAEMNYKTLKMNIERRPGRRRFTV